MKNTVRILVVDDHDVVRKGVIGTIATHHPEWEVCGEASDGRQAVEAASKLQPDMIVMDITMPSMNGLDATRQILKVSPETEILILSMHDSEQLVRDVLNSGARGYVLKADAGTDLISALESLSEHKLFFTSRIGELVLRGYLNKDNQPATSTQLTAREREIVQLVAEGKANKEIAAILHVSIKTIESHRARLMDKLSLHSVSDLVRYAIRNKLIEC